MQIPIEEKFYEVYFNPLPDQSGYVASLWPPSDELERAVEGTSYGSAEMDEMVDWAKGNEAIGAVKAKNPLDEDATNPLDEEEPDDFILMVKGETKEEVKEKFLAKCLDLISLGVLKTTFDEIRKDLKSGIRFVTHQEEKERN